MPDGSAVRGSSRWKKILLLLLAGAGIAIFAYGAVQDLSLDLKAGKIPAGIPDSVLENIDLDREINGDLWKANVGKVERGKDWATLYSISVDVERVNGQLWTLRAPEGLYLEKEQTAEISRPRGTMSGGGVAFRYAAPLARWNRETGRILFPEGFEASGDLGRFQAEYMELLPEGIMEADKGASIQWYDQEDHDPESEL